VLHEGPVKEIKIKPVVYKMACDLKTEKKPFWRKVANADWYLFSSTEANLQDWDELYTAYKQIHHHPAQSWEEYKQKRFQVNRTI
jgi:hypothetical protein